MDERIQINGGRGITMVTGLILVVMATSKYRSLHTSVYDLGVFFSNLYQISILGIWKGIFVGHVQPFLLIWAFIYGVFPVEFAPYILLSLQSLMLVLPGFWLARQYGILGVLALVLYFPIWYNALFDFHTDHLVVPLLFWFFLLVEKKQYRLAAVPALTLALVKEPYALQTVACGIFLLICKKEYRTGTLIALAGIVYFLLCTKVLIPYFSLGGGSEVLGTSAYSWLGSGIFEMMHHVLTSPFAVLKEILWSREKLYYLIAVFGSFGFLPLFRPGYLIVALPIFAISLLAAENYFGIRHHYTAGLVAPMVIAFLKGKDHFLAFAEKYRVGREGWIGVIALGMVFANIWFSPSPISRNFWLGPDSPRHSWEYHYSVYFETERDRMIKSSLENFIPKDAPLVVSSQNTLNWARLFNRRNYYAFPQTVFEPNPEADWKEFSYADFLDFPFGGPPGFIKRFVTSDRVILDLKRPWFIGDRACPWVHGQCNDKELRDKFQGFVEQAIKTHRILFEKDGFYILDRPQN